MLPAAWAEAQTAADAPLQISWEVRNRFRLFREERDFLLHAEARAAAASSPPSRRWNCRATAAAGRATWSNRLCIDLSGRVSEPCTRDNVKESYLTPIDHPIVVRLTGPVPVGATCAWSFDDGDGPQGIDLRLRRAGQSPRPLRPHHGRDRRCLQRIRRHPARLRPRSRCATSSSPASATASPPAKAIRTARSRCPTKAFASAPISDRRARNITGRAAPATRAAAPARRRTPCRSGSARARSGSTPPATARSTATRPAPRWRSPCTIRTSR